MIDLMIVDFDRTLIKYNSVKLLIKHLNKPKLWYYAILRKLKLISKNEFSAKITKYFERYTQKYGCEKIEKIIVPFINESVLSHINSYKSIESEILILSASPNCYIEEIASSLGYNGHGSHYEDKFNYVYGVNKLNYVLEKFPKSKYVYYYAISDHESDQSMLKEFKNSFLLKNGLEFHKFIKK